MTCTSSSTRRSPHPAPRFVFFFFNDTATTEIYTLSLHDALPIFGWPRRLYPRALRSGSPARRRGRSEEHTSELQSLRHLVCRLLLEKKQLTSPTISMPRSRATATERSFSAFVT